MALSRPVAPFAAGCFLFLLLASHFAAAQAPPEVPTDANPMDQAYGFIVTAPTSFVEIPYLQNAVVPLIVEDLSRDSSNAPEANVNGGYSPSTHTVSLTVVDVRPPQPNGWQIMLAHPVIPLIGGQTFESSILIAPTPQVESQFVSADIEAIFSGPNGYTRNQTITISAKVAPYDFSLVQVAQTDVAKQVGQFEKVQFQIQVLNDAVYPNSYQFKATTEKDAFKVISPPNLYVPAKSIRYTNVTVLTPKGTPYEFGENTVINIEAKALQNGGGTYTAVAVLKVQGGYVSTPWIPAILVGLVSAALLVRERRHNAELRRLEKGLPRRVQPTPRQTVLLSELKRRDPDAYKARRAQLAGMYAERREEYKGTRKERLARDRAEHKQARLELREEQKRKKAAALLAKKQAKADKKEAKKQAKLDKKAAKKQAKVDKKEAKVLAKKRKALEKQKAKLEKQHAKASAKEAKAQAKVDKAAARQAKRDAKKRK